MFYFYVLSHITKN